MADQRAAAAVLLARARDDLTAGRLLLETPATDAIVGFFAQQTVEKALKAVLIDRGLDYPFTHDLSRLIERCEAAGVDLPPGLAEADELSAFAGRLRYDAPLSGTVVARAVAMAWAESAVAFAASIIEL